MTLTIAGRPVEQIGLGFISFLKPHAVVPVEDAIATMKTALNAGANFWNASEHYGTPEYNSLHLLNAYFTKYPEDAEKVVISVKGCFDAQTASAATDAEGVKKSIENILRILGGKCRLEIFQPGRLDPDTPVEVTVNAIAEYVKSGKVGGIGLSEPSAASIRKAAAVHPIAAVEVELSLFSTQIMSNGIANACKEHNIPIVAYSPLARGFLTGQLKKFEDLPAKDFRHMFPRFQREVFDDNLKLVAEVERLAESKGCSTAQVALAWVSEQTQTLGVPVIPIPGAAAASRVQENTAVIKLTRFELDELNEVVQRIEIKGERTPARFAHLLEI